MCAANYKSALYYFFVGIYIYFLRIKILENSNRAIQKVLKILL
jgi:hypothetical protein